MTDANTAKTVAEALSAVDRWRTDEDARRIAELGEVAQEIKSLEAAVENLRQQLDALHTFRAELESKGSDLEALATQRAYQSIFEVLQVQAAAVEQRERELQAAAKKRDAELVEKVKQAGLESVLAEVEEFRAKRQEALAGVPASFRPILIDAHEKQVEQLRAVVLAASGGPAGAKPAPIAVDLVFAIDAMDEGPELIVVVSPVADTVQSQWIDRDDGLQTWLGARVAQALYQASMDVGFVGAQALSGGHMGLLAVELELVGADARIGDALRRRLNEVAASPELVGAGVSAVVREVSLDQLLPPDDAAEGEEGDDAE